MAGCIPNSLFLSEVLVILSSCVFVVMALLTAVVSVTSITFTDKNEPKQEHHCHLPNRFSVKNSFDLPSYSELFSNFLPSKIEYQNSVFYSFRFLIISSLRNNLIENGFIANHFNLNIISDNLFQIIESSLKVYKIDYNISEISLKLICSAISEYGEVEYLPFFKNNQSIHKKISFRLNTPSFLFDINSIKSTLVNKSKPLAISIPFDLNSFYNNEQNNLSFSEKLDLYSLSKKSFVYLIYGWSDDFIIETSQDKNNPLIGGFIVRQFIQETYGHSISYIYGNLSSYEETLFCPKITNNLHILDLHKVELICTNNNKCNSTSRYLLESQNLPKSLTKEIKNKSKFAIDFSEVPEREAPRKVSLDFQSFDELTSSFSVKTQFMIDQCNYFFLPYDIFTKVFALSKTVEQLSYGISSSIDWIISEDIDLSQYISAFSDRPIPLFEI